MTRGAGYLVQLVILTGKSGLLEVLVGRGLHVGQI
jgi:hypothetical protein